MSARGFDRVVPGEPLTPGQRENSLGVRAAHHLQRQRRPDEEEEILRRQYHEREEPGTPERRPSRRVLPPLSRRSSSFRKSSRSLAQGSPSSKGGTVEDVGSGDMRKSQSRRVSIKSRISSALRSVKDEGNRAELQERFELLLDNEYKYANRPEVFHEKLQVLLDYINDLLNRQEVADFAERATIESKVEAAQRWTFFAWKLFQIALTLHLVFLAALSIYPDITRHLKTPAGFLTDLNDLFSHAYFVIYAGGGYLVVLLPGFITASQRTLGWTILALAGVVIDLGYHFAFTAYGLASFMPDTDFNVGPFILYFLEGIPLLMEMVALSIVINRWNVAHNRVVKIKKTKKADGEGAQQDMASSQAAARLDDSGFAADALGIAVTSGGPGTHVDMEAGSPRSQSSRRRSRLASSHSHRRTASGSSRPSSSRGGGGDRRPSASGTALSPEDLQ